MFIQTEPTSDPEKLKFLPGREVLPGHVLHLRDRGEAGRSPLAERLFRIPGVTGVSFDADSITVRKGGGEWPHLKAAILAEIMDHFVSGAPLLRDDSAPSASAPADEALAPMWQALRQVIDPELGYNIVDLGLVYEVDAEDGVVRILMTTTTPGCPATNYLRQGAGESVNALPGVDFVEVEMTYSPRWTPEMMSPAAKAHFGIRG